MRIVITVIIILISSLKAFSQSGLNINTIFVKYHNKKNAVEVLVRGRQLRDYDLTSFHSITITAPAHELATLEDYVLKDARQAREQETALVGKRLFYGFYQLAPTSSGENRYIIFRNRSVKGRHTDAMVIYLEGKATMNEIKKQFK